jgi:hypothetical protein
LGEVWASRGTKTPGARNENLENTVKVEGATNWRGASLIHFQAVGDPFPSMSLTMDMTNAYLGGRRLQDSVFVDVQEAKRSFAAKYLSKSQALFILQDRFYGGGDTVWEMFTPLNTVTVEGNKFVIKSLNGAMMKGTFLQPQSASVGFDAKKGRIYARGGKDYLVVIILNRGEQIHISTEDLNAGYRFSVGSHRIEIKNDIIQIN